MFTRYGVLKFSITAYTSLSFYAYVICVEESKSLKFCSAIPAIPTSEAYGDLNGPMPQLVDANEQGADARQFRPEVMESRYRVRTVKKCLVRVSGLPKCERNESLI